MSAFLNIDFDDVRVSHIFAFLVYLIFACLMLFASFPLKPIKIDEIPIKNSTTQPDDKMGEYLITIDDQVKFPRKKEFEILTYVFSRADIDKNEKLDLKELTAWIRFKILQHISNAIDNNRGLFDKVDVQPKDGVITWNEYHAYFLKKHGFSDKFISEHDERRHRGMSRPIKEQIMKHMALWTDSAKTHPDYLTVQEFLAFTHPESNLSNQLALVDELFDKFDRDGDEILTENEFAIYQPEGDGEQTLIIRQEENKRREEFRNSVDLNNDGKADRRELLNYVAPESPRHAEHEAEALLSLADTDNNKTLSVEEMLAHPDLFIKSKMVDTAQSFHDEF